MRRDHGLCRSVWHGRLHTNLSAPANTTKLATTMAEIDMPYPTQVMLRHDQAQAIDGVCCTQREAWPQRRGGSQPQPARDLRGGSDDGARPGDDS